MAALCHDIGHLPFSHAAEKELLPKDWDHESLSVEIIKSDEMREIWESMTPPLRADEIAKLAVGQKTLKNEDFTDWETILSEIIVGDAFGVDRMDYLLRDSLHSGVAYGKFDHHRLMDTLRILPPSESESESSEPALGIEEGGIHSAEALLLARYFMYTQVYYHHVRRIYDKHLIAFLSGWLENGTFPNSYSEILKYSDIEVMNAIYEANLKADDNVGNLRHDAARRIVRREHFKRIYSRNSSDVSRYAEPGKAIYAELAQKYGSGRVIHDFDERGGEAVEFPVIEGDGRIVSSEVASDVLANIPKLTIDRVYVDPIIVNEARAWILSERDRILDRAAEQEVE